MGNNEQYDVVVIGAGPGGYAAAIVAAQRGLKAAIVDKDRLGGTCLNYGCIPSKALLDSTHMLTWMREDAGDHGFEIGKLEVDFEKLMARKDKVVQQLTGGVGTLLKGNGVDVHMGAGRLVSPGEVEVEGADGKTRLRTRHVIIATGSSVATIPTVELDGERIFGSTEALELKAVPKSLAVIGGGFIGLEIGSVYNRLGSEVTVLEMTDGILPGTDREIAKALQRSLTKQGLDLRLKHKVLEARASRKGVRLRAEDADGKEIKIEAERLLVAVGRRPYTAGLGLEALGVETRRDGSIVVDDRMRTNVPGVWAIGDAVGGLMLAHKASKEADVVVDNIAGHDTPMDYAVVPYAVFTVPEVASVGLSEEAARERHGEVKIGKFPFAASGRALALGETEGMVKVIAAADTDDLLGVHVIGAHASDLIAEATTAMAFDGTAEDVALPIHVHPTLPEAMMEAALAVHGRAVHTVNRKRR